MPSKTNTIYFVTPAYFQDDAEPLVFLYADVLAQFLNRTTYTCNVSTNQSKD